MKLYKHYPNSIKENEDFTELHLIEHPVMNNSFRR